MDTLDCPRCHQPMRSHAAHGLEAWTCRRCAGAFVASEVKQALEQVSAAELQQVLGGATLQPVDLGAGVDCPRCSLPMARHEVRRVLVDTCIEHGTWYDRGELRRVVESLRGTRGRRAAVVAGTAGAVGAALGASRSGQPASERAVGAVLEVGAEAGADLVVGAALNTALEGAGTVGEGVVEFLGELLGGLLG